MKIQILKFLLINRNHAKKLVTDIRCIPTESLCLSQENVQHGEHNSLSKNLDCFVNVAGYNINKKLRVSVIEISIIKKGCRLITVIKSSDASISLKNRVLQSLGSKKNYNG